MYSLRTRCAALWSRCRAGWQRLFLTTNELQLALLLMALWPVVQWGLWFFFPEAAPLDGGQLHKLYLACLVFAAGHGFLWLGLKFNLPALFGFVEQEFSTAFHSLTPWQKLLLFLGFWSAYLFCFALCWLGASQVA